MIPNEVIAFAVCLFITAYKLLVPCKGHNSAGFMDICASCTYEEIERKHSLLN